MYGWVGGKRHAQFHKREHLKNRQTSVPMHAGTSKSLGPRSGEPVHARTRIKSLCLTRASSRLDVERSTSSVELEVADAVLGYS